MTDPESKAATAAARARLTHWTIPQLRHIQVEGMTAGGWMRFEYDEDGYIEKHSSSDNVTYTKEKTGIQEVSFWEIQAAWEIAFELTPKSAMHVSVTHPAGTRLHSSRWMGRELDMVEGMCTVVGFTAQHVNVRFDGDDDDRSMSMKDPAFWRRA